LFLGELPLSLIEKKARGCQVSLSDNAGFTLPDMGNLADDIIKIDLSSCSLTGNVNLEVQPSDSRVCSVGSIPDFSKNVNLKNLYLSSNSLSGKFVGILNRGPAIRIEA
jgi:hypothetical protein